MNVQFDNPSGRRPPAAASATIRRAIGGDAQRLSAFASRTFTDTYGAHNTAENLRLHLASSYTGECQTRELADARVITLLAHVGDELAAYAQVRCGEMPACVPAAAAVELHRFYVDRCWHGCGLSQQLLAQARVAARAFDASTLWLKVWERNPRAIAFYCKSGFVDVGGADFHVGTDRQRDRVLVLDLSQGQG